MRMKPVRMLLPTRLAALRNPSSLRPSAASKRRRDAPARIESWIPVSMMLTISVTCAFKRLSRRAND